MKKLLFLVPIIVFAQPDEPFLWAKSLRKMLAPPQLFAESLHSYDVRHYRLDIDLPMSSASYTCREAVALKSNLPFLDTIGLDFAGLICDSVKRGPVPLTFDILPERLLIHLDSALVMGESTAIEIFFHRESTAQQRGFFFAQPPRLLHAHAMTCGCPRDNHYWFACWDWPNDKAERGCEINLTVPDTFQACANGVLDSVTLAPGGKKTWWWRHSYPINTYLMTFSASRFARWDTVVVGPNGDTVPLIYFMWPRDSAITRTGYRLVPDMMIFYSDTNRFGPYPFERFGMVPGYYGFPWGGMEHQTQVMIHTSYIGGGGEATICHELSHMWWGDMVTHVGYADVWLNEGFASWAECLYMGHLNGRAYFQNYIAGKARQYFSQHRSRDFPIYNPPWSEIYNYGIVYCKGSWILRMLQFLTGDTTWQHPGVFYRALRVYGDSFKYRTVATADFHRITEQVTGVSLDTFFNEWVYDRGYPRFFLRWSKGSVGDSWRVVVNLTQQNDTSSCPFFHIPLPVRFNLLQESLTVVFTPEDTGYFDTLMFSTEPLSLTTDPDNWILDSCYVTLVGLEEIARIGVQVRLVQPNPAKDWVRFQLTGVSSTPLQIYDNTGRLVAELHPRTETLDWNCTDRNGARVRAGVYFVRLGSKNAPIVKLILLTAP
ncbi:MAG: M1 family aminopeptidase [bacterium]